MRQLALTIVLLLGTLLPVSGFGFCGFYVSESSTKLYNNATRVVMMRKGTQTVLSMQNDYIGPPQDFAMVIPVPQVLQKKNVKTLPRAIFDHVDQLGSPRLVEYQESDPCAPPMRKGTKFYDFNDIELEGSMRPSLVEVEAEFAVGEYDIVVLSANDGAGLDKWLRAHKYNIPKGAGPLFKPYIDSGMYFFVAKVNAKRLKFQGKRAVLSPLRFHYTSKDFQLPVRLGLINSSGQQDLIVNILGTKRYEVANLPNVFIPTNLTVKDAVRKQFPAFYEGLLASTFKKNPKAVVTEYAWDVGNCDPCPGVNGLMAADILTLGGDVLDINGPSGIVLTRLHARYKTLQADLVFKGASPVVGGRELWKKSGLEQGASQAPSNAFQARYAIRHRWGKKITCDNPIYKQWGFATPPSRQTPNQKTQKSTKNNVKRPKDNTSHWSDSFDAKPFKIEPKKFIVDGL